MRRKTEVGDRIIFYKDKTFEADPVEKEFQSMYVPPCMRGVVVVQLGVHTTLYYTCVYIWHVLSLRHISVKSIEIVRTLVVGVMYTTNN